MPSFDTLPATAQEFSTWKWDQIEPYFKELESRDLNDANVAQWLKDWTHLDHLINEARTRLYVATTVDTTDEAGVQRFHAYLKDVMEAAQSADQKLKEKFLAANLQPVGMEIPLRDMRSEAELFRQENIPLGTEEEKLGTEYDKIIGAQTVMWEGKELTISQLRPIYQDTNRAVREKAWKAAAARQLEDTESLSDLWTKFMPLRRQIASNAGFSDYRSYRWKELKRFDYTPEDSATFRGAIEQVVVPAAKRIYARWQQQLGVDTLRPWDLIVDKTGKPPLRPFQQVSDLEARTEAIFKQVDPQLGEYFATMRRENLLDLENRKGKAPGGYQIDFRTVKRPFIFMNAVGMHQDVITLLHEGGHAFHCFETGNLPYMQQLEFGPEIAEVASMSMELLAAPYLTSDNGGFYTSQEAARARIEHLEGIIYLLPWIAQVDAFQHWVYTHEDEALDPLKCSAKWSELWGRFMGGVDYTGLEDWVATRWQRQLHIFQIPFYYIDYGMAQVGALQVWRNALHNQAEAVKQYRYGLSLGNTRPLPELFAAVGAKFAFDTDTLGELVGLVEKTISDLEGQLAP